MRRNPPPTPPQTKDQTGPAPELLRVVPVARRVDFDGGRWWITAIAIWDDRVSVESAVWDDTWSYEPPIAPGRGRGTPRFHWRILIEDEAATCYSPKGGGGSSSGHWQRVNGELEPAPPADVTKVTVVLTRLAWPDSNGDLPTQPAEVARVMLDLE